MPRTDEPPGNRHLAESGSSERESGSGMRDTEHEHLASIIEACRLATRHAKAYVDSLSQPAADRIRRGYESAPFLVTSDGDGFDGFWSKLWHDTEACKDCSQDVSAEYINTFHEVLMTEIEARGSVYRSRRWIRYQRTRTRTRTR